MKEKIIKVEPLKCENCGSSQVFKPNKNKIQCDECKYVFDLRKDTKEKVKTSRNFKGRNPRFDTGDFLE